MGGSEYEDQPWDDDDDARDYFDDFDDRYIEVDAPNEGKELEDRDWIYCNRCNSTGKVSLFVVFLQTCPKCHGVGKIRKPDRNW